MAPDYKLPILGHLHPSADTIVNAPQIIKDLLHVQNCNSVVYTILKELGIKLILPKDQDGKEVIALGVDSEIRDTMLDKMMKGEDLTPAEIEELGIAFAISAGTALGGWGALVAGRSAVSKVRGYYKAKKAYEDETKKAYEEDAKKGGDEAKKDNSKNGVGRGEDGKNGGNDDNDNSNNDGDDGVGGGFIGGIGSANNEKAKIRADEAVEADEKARIRADDAAEVAVLAEMHEVVTAAIREAIVEVQQLEAELAGTILASANTKVIAEAVQQLKKVA